LDVKRVAATIANFRPLVLALGVALVATACATSELLVGKRLRLLVLVGAPPRARCAVIDLRQATSPLR
jgi:hypothetical protein